MKMKALFNVAAALMLCAAVQAQNDVTKFLGIPVDGSKSEMISKLKAKGFTDDPYLTGGLVGEFNGVDVNVYVVTNKDKVWRIMVCDKTPIDETGIRIRFNTLCQQFLNNDNYMPASTSPSAYTLPAGENISYEMSVNKKRYEAVFWQMPADTATVNAEHVKETRAIINSKYTEEQLANPTDEIVNDVISISYAVMAEKYSVKSVWFTISDYAGQYYITMYYDNEYNKANGEDL